MKTLAGLAAVAAIAVSLIGANGAAAFTEIGNNCGATLEYSAAATVTQYEEASANPLPLNAPGAGIVTRWRINTGVPSGASQEKLKILRGAPLMPVVVAESATETIDAEQNVFETRIPVQAGDRLGVYGNPGFHVCETLSSDDNIVGHGDDSPVGSNPSFGPGIANAFLAVSAIIEPDADGDGFGDETQDLCPTNASVHGACPSATSTDSGPTTDSGSTGDSGSTSPPALSVQALALPPGKRAIHVLVASNYDAKVAVNGQIGWGARTPKGKRVRLIVGLDGGGRNVAPGQIVAFKMKLPRSVLRRLHRLTPKQSLRAKLSAVATDSSGQTASDRLVVKLKGLARRR